jgi:peroxidase
MTFQDINKVTSITLKASQHISKLKGKEHLKNIKVPHRFCPFRKNLNCHDTKYRSYDGSCNNLNNPWWGKSETPYTRLLDPVYADSITKPKHKSSTTENDLPHPRLVTNTIHWDKENSEIMLVTSMFPHFSQFVDHDLTLTALVSDDDGAPIDCKCNQHNSDCINIPSLTGDTEFNRGQRCQVTQRSAANFQNFDCNLGAREQTNLLTSWIDLSSIYGNTKEASHSLRSHHGGKLIYSKIRNIHGSYLPFKTHKHKCLFIEDGDLCFESGDIRVNQNLPLTSIHTIFLREHNRIADSLHAINPSWHDERLYQETRRIMIAQFSHVMFNEWLPILIGPNLMFENKLIPKFDDFFTEYNPEVTPNVYNEFATAAFRFGHSMVRSWIDKLDANYEPYSMFSNISFDDVVFDARHAFKKGGLDSIARGCLKDKTNSFDPHFNEQLTHHLFENVKAVKHLDSKRFSLPSLNINRGRDHGLPGYNQYRSLCGLNLATNFDELYNIPLELREKLAQIYDDVNDIDLYTGGTSELPMDSSILGPTFACKYINFDN